MSGYIINDFIFSINESDISITYGKISTKDFIINISLKEYLTNIKTEIDLPSQVVKVLKQENLI